MKTFWIRTASAAVYVLLFLGTLLSGWLLKDVKAGMLIFTAFLVFVTVGCTYEFFRMVGRQGSTPCKTLGYFLAVAIVLIQGFLPMLNMVAGFSLMLVLIAVMPMLFALAAIIQLWGRSEQPFREAAYSLVPFFYIGWPLSLMLMLIPEVGTRLLFMVILMVWVNDSAAYIGGSLFGRHKMWQRHSPGKTWEGTAFGVLVTLLLAFFLGPVIQPGIGRYQWLVLGLICSVVDTLGDLVESMLKRSVDVKDSGSIMPGHGGFLDRFDSLLIIMPFVYAYITLVAYFQ